MKTSTAELTKKAHNYIVECIDPEAYEVGNIKTKEGKLQFLYNTFKKEYCYPENLKRYGSELNCFREWCMGLPSIFHIAFTNYDIIQLAKEWGSLDQDATEREEEKILNNYWNFIAVKAFQLFSKNGITA